MEWHHSDSQRPKKFRGERSTNKLLATVFWDMHGVIAIDFLPRGHTMNSENYIRVLTYLKARIKRVRPNLAMDEVLFHHDNAPCHTNGQTREKIASFWWKTLSHPPYSPDLAPSDYHLFAPLKRHLKRNSYDGDNDYKTAVTAWLKQQPEEFYRRGIHNLARKWNTAIQRREENIED